MDNKSKIIFYLVFLVVIIFLVIIVIHNNSEQRANRGQKPDYSMEAVSLFNEFTTDENESNLKYLGKCIEVKGRVAEYGTDNNGNSFAVLRPEPEMTGVRCIFLNSNQPSISSFEIGKQVVVQGTCSGFELDVVLTRCTLSPQ